MSEKTSDSTVERRFRLTGYSGVERDAQIAIRSFDRPGRLKRAATGLATWWGAAALSILIPVAHFFLVPGFLVWGVVVSVRRLKTSDIVVSAHGTCPDCGTEQDLDMLGPWIESRDVICRECHRPIHLTAT